MKSVQAEQSTWRDMGGHGSGAGGMISGGAMSGGMMGGASAAGSFALHVAAEPGHAATFQFTPTERGTYVFLLHCPRSPGGEIGRAHV